MTRSWRPRMARARVASMLQGDNAWGNGEGGGGLLQCGQGCGRAGVSDVIPGKLSQASCRARFSAGEAKTRWVKLQSRPGGRSARDPREGTIKSAAVYVFTRQPHGSAVPSSLMTGAVRRRQTDRRQRRRRWRRRWRRRRWRMRHSPAGAHSVGMAGGRRGKHIRPGEVVNHSC